MGRIDIERSGFSLNDVSNWLGKLVTESVYCKMNSILLDISNSWNEYYKILYAWLC